MNDDNQEYQDALKLFNDKDYKGAFEKYLIITQQNPDFADALNDAGLCYMHLGNYTEARHFLEKALKLELDNWVSYYNLARVNVKEENYQDALPLLQKAVELGGDKDVVYDLALDYNILATKELDAGSSEKALEYANKAIAYFSEDPDFHETLGDILVEEGQPEEALKSYQRAQEMNSTSVDLLQKITDLEKS